MAEKSVAEKAHVKPGAKIAVVNRVPGIVDSLGLPEGVTFVDPAEADLVFVFVRSQAELEQHMPPVAEALGSATLWVFYPKGSKAAGHDVSRDTIWALAESLGLKPVGLVSVDEVWSMFRLRRAG
jgi:hypothetical protein